MDDMNDNDDISNMNNNDNDITESGKKNKRSISEQQQQSDPRQTDFDDIMSFITSKMDALSTTSEDVSKDEIIAIFMQVLECADGEAVFYLESTGWDIEMAVQLKFESDDNQYYSKRGRTFGSRPFLDPVFQETGINNKYIPKECNIEGLPDGWKAVVSRKTGTIYFVNEAFNIRQSQVPPGFADAVIDQPPVTNNNNDTEVPMGNDNNGTEVAMGDDNGAGTANNQDLMTEEI